MRPQHLALLCLLLSACPPQDHVVPDPDPGDGDGSMDDSADDSTDDDGDGRAACEAAGGTWEECPPNADCTFFCKQPTEDGEPDGDGVADGDDVVGGDDDQPDGDDQPEPRCLDHGSQESCDAAAGCTWDRCSPTADCTYQCWGQFECEAGGGTWKECPPNADCVHNAWCSLSERSDPDPGTFACGDARCSAGQFCEIVSSDVPEFDGSYQRYTCRQMPECDKATCACLEGRVTCSVFDLEVPGACSEPTPGEFTFSCGIGG
jgi:hypothetical protein